MIAKEEFINSSEPATKGDLENLREDLQGDMVQMEERINTRIDSLETRMDAKFEQIDARFERIEKTLTAILKVLDDMSNRLAAIERNTRDLPERVTVLEDDVLKLKAAAH
ncbi:MAG: hypothetical protein HYZ63_01305 [Candidatus Andersenbacteria bacterium]|nr:hypothetical protein [Candidatus Andersenbacteria bacterium]